MLHNHFCRADRRQQYDIHSYEAEAESSIPVTWHQEMNGHVVLRTHVELHPKALVHNCYIVRASMYAVDTNHTSDAYVQARLSHCVRRIPRARGLYGARECEREKGEERDRSDASSPMDCRRIGNDG